MMNSTKINHSTSSSVEICEQPIEKTDTPESPSYLEETERSQDDYLAFRKWMHNQKQLCKTSNRVVKCRDSETTLHSFKSCPTAAYPCDTQPPAVKSK